MRLFSNGEFKKRCRERQMNDLIGWMRKNNQWHTRQTACVPFSPDFDVICDLLLNRLMAILNLFVNEDPNQIVLSRVLGLKGTTYETPCEAYRKRLESYYAAVWANNDFDVRSVSLRLSVNHLGTLELVFVFGLFFWLELGLLFVSLRRIVRRTLYDVYILYFLSEVMKKFSRKGRGDSVTHASNNVRQCMGNPEKIS